MMPKRSLSSMTHADLQKLECAIWEAHEHAQDEGRKLNWYELLQQAKKLLEEQARRPKQALRLKFRSYRRSASANHSGYRTRRR
jgi:hypothetical protein